MPNKKNNYLKTFIKAGILGLGAGYIIKEMYGFALQHYYAYQFLNDNVGKGSYALCDWDVIDLNMQNPLDKASIVDPYSYLVRVPQCASQTMTNSLYSEAYEYAHSLAVVGKKDIALPSTIIGSPLVGSAVTLFHPAKNVSCGKQDPLPAISLKK